ncbi:MAG: hypothetical protein JWN39_364, partial [Ilumatobacteraceae bacterium]|nr:hypothetical protein [Ilumatobacteraceae bacterium]
MTDHSHDEGADHNATEFEEFVREHELDGPDLHDNGDDVVVPEIVIDDEPESEVDTLTREVAQFKDTALRLQADFENYRKRVTAQQADEIDRAA